MLHFSEKLEKELFSYGNFKNIKWQCFKITFLLKSNVFLNKYILASLEMHFSLIQYQTRIHWRSINGDSH